MRLLVAQGGSNMLWGHRGQRLASWGRSKTALDREAR